MFVKSNNVSCADSTNVTNTTCPHSHFQLFSYAALQYTQWAMFKTCRQINIYSDTMTAHNTYTNTATLQHTPTHTHTYKHTRWYTDMHTTLTQYCLLSKVLFSYCDHTHNHTLKIKDSNSKLYTVKHKKPEQFNKINFK